jgi:hypothetical protein
VLLPSEWVAQLVVRKLIERKVMSVRSGTVAFRTVLCLVCFQGSLAGAVVSSPHTLPSLFPLAVRPFEQIEFNDRETSVG